MTCREKLKIEHPEYVGSCYTGGCEGCPKDYGYLDDPDYCANRSHRGFLEHKCGICWDREIPCSEPDVPKMKERTINQMLKGEDYDDGSDERSIEELLEENAKLRRMLESKNGLIGTLKEQLKNKEEQNEADINYYQEMEIDLLDKIRVISELKKEIKVYAMITAILEKKIKDLGGEV